MTVFMTDFFFNSECMILPAGASKSRFFPGLRLIFPVKRAASFRESGLFAGKSI
jgi:hypothetical protein